MRMVPASEQQAIPWKNGGGTTREIARSPAGASLDTFDWRVSRAHVAVDGPFSRFDGVERTLLVMTGHGLRLRLEGREVTLSRASAPFSFAGDAAVDAALVRGPIEDLNVMTRRGHARHAVERVRVAEATELRARGDATVVVVESGVLVLEATTLHAEDALVADADEVLAVRSAAGADLVVIHVWTTTDAG